MAESLIFTQNTISTFQAQVEMLEQCLDYPNAQHETIAELLEIANARQISLEELKQEMVQFKQKFDKLLKLFRYQGKLWLLYFVKSQFLLKEILDSYWDFFLVKSHKEVIRSLTLDHRSLYQELKNRITPETSKDDKDYIAVEALKHSINSLIETGLRVNAFSQQEIDTFDLGDITPQESETVLIFLSTMKKWEPVYKKLAAS